MPKRTINETPLNQITIVAKTARVEGSVTSDFDIRVDGIVEGDLHIGGRAVILGKW